jgi:hypothetical protein
MKTPTFFFLALCASCLFIFSAYTEKKEALPSLKIIQKDSTDILQTVKAWQEQMPKPSDKFRPGHASPRQMEEYLEKKEDGFVIQLPAKSLTPSPTIYKGMVLVSGGFGSKEYYAFDAQTGEVKWAINLDDDGPTSAVVQDDIVVFNTESCTIFACNVMTGELLWSHYLGDPLMSTPSVADGVVYTAYPAQRALGGYQNAPYNYQQQNSVQQMPGNNVGNLTIAPGGNQQGQMEKDSVDLKVDLRPSHIMIALELKTGKILWQKWIDGDIMSAPVVEGDEVLATTFPGTLYKFQAKTGEILAAKAGRATSAPVVVGNDIYMSQRSDDGRFERPGKPQCLGPEYDHGKKSIYQGSSLPGSESTKQISLEIHSYDLRCRQRLCGRSTGQFRLAAGQLQHWAIECVFVAGLPGLSRLASSGP